ncbi:serine/arginine-rich splicing factor 5-like isoform X2 [Hemiscyllium ocellatum]|uniref:serine/arginine-rich splicing factor 5-like isoform X2 n=1 Tax=Hemiscyllium ocellatum TaxID=170820 RepID=UPI0029671F71|nr:serine/arginine-rich splicing factor 5-like isoform X2 [Hemiscyllium ocellatum]
MEKNFAMKGLQLNMLDHDQEEVGTEAADSHHASVIADQLVEEKKEVAVQFTLNTELLWKICPPGLVGRSPSATSCQHISSFNLENDMVCVDISMASIRSLRDQTTGRVHFSTDLKDLMKQAGEVTFVDAHRNKNEGVVEFATSSDMRNALNKLEGKEINGRKIRLIEDRKRRTRSRSHNRSSSRSRSRSPSSKQSKSESRSRSRSRGKSHSASRSPVRKDQPVMNNQAHSRSKYSGLTNQSRSRSRSVESAD